MPVAVVALGGPLAHRVRDGDHDRRAGRGRGQGPGRPAASCWPSIRAIVAALDARRAEGGLGNAAAEGPRARHRACTSLSAASARRWPRCRSKTATCTVHRVVAAFDCGLVGESADRARRRCRAPSPSGFRPRCTARSRSRTARCEQSQLPRLPGAAHERDADGRSAHRRLRRRQADRRRRAGHAADRAGGRQCLFALTGKRVRTLPLGKTKWA